MLIIFSLLFQWLNDEHIVKKLVNSITVEYDEDVSTSKLVGPRSLVDRRVES